MIRSRLSAFGATFAMLAGCTSTTTGAAHPDGTASSTPPATVASTAPTTGSPPSETATGIPSPDASEATFEDPGAVQALLTASARALEVVNSYDYRSLDAAFVRGSAFATGQYATKYAAAFRVLRRQAPAVHAVQRATTNAVGVRQLDGDQGDVIVFLTLHMRSTKSGARSDVYSIDAKMQRLNGSWLIADLVPATGSVTSVGTAGVTYADLAAQSAVGEIDTLHRARFDADYDTALSATTGKLHSDLVANREQTRRALVKGGADITGRVLTTGIESVSGSSATVLVLAETTRRGVVTSQRLRLTVVRTADKWLASDLVIVGAS